MSRSARAGAQGIQGVPDLIAYESTLEKDAVPAACAVPACGQHRVCGRRRAAHRPAGISRRAAPRPRVSRQRENIPLDGVGQRFLFAGHLRPVQGRGAVFHRPQL